jgi:hypothetical protein
MLSAMTLTVQVSRKLNKFYPIKQVEHLREPITFLLRILSTK